VQYPHCCSITMVIGCSAPAVPSQSRVRYVCTRTYVLRTRYYVLRSTYHVDTYIRGYCALPRGKKKFYHALYLRTYLCTSMLVGYGRVLVFSLNDVTGVHSIISTHQGTLLVYCQLKIHNFFQLKSY
jgi:hypothetical protein